MSGNRFRSKTEAMGKRNHSWACLGCRASFQQKFKSCPECQAPVHYFPSKAELRRFRALQLEQQHGSISNLELQPSYPVVINGQKVCTYRADFKYIRDDQTVIEDVKGTRNEKYLDPLFKLKRKLIEAIYGINISITT